MVNDPVADMLTRIKTAQAVKKETVVIPYSKLKMEIAKILLRLSYIKDVQRRGRKTSKIIEINLMYQDGVSKINDLKQVSKSSRRVYKSAKDLKAVRGGYGLAIVSTTRGLLSDKEARDKNIGGEVICEIW